MVTPPPCFTAGGSSPQQLATSPMEDLLIEHPSMSVYHSQGHEPSMKAPSPSSGMVTRARARQQQQGKQVAVKKTRNLRVRNVAPPRRAAAVAARAGIVQAPSVSAIEEVQTAKRLQGKMMSRSKMSRQNKTYHQSNRSRHHYRQDIMGRHSGAIYKQKC